MSRVGRWPRLAAAVACLLFAAVSALEASQAKATIGPGESARLVVTTRALPAGHQLTASDVLAVRRPIQFRPPGAVSVPHEVIGRRLAGPIAAGEAVTPLRLLGHDLTTGLGADVVAAPVRIESQVARLVHAGDRVDLIAVPRPDAGAVGTSRDRTETAQIVAAGVRVLAAFEATDANTAAGLTADDTQLVLAVQRPVALRIAALETSQLFSVVARGP